jgi:hypothetical protein
MLRNGIRPVPKPKENHRLRPRAKVFKNNTLNKVYIHASTLPASDLSLRDIYQKPPIYVSKYIIFNVFSYRHIYVLYLA